MSEGDTLHARLCEAIVEHLRRIEGLGLQLDGGVRNFDEMGADSIAMMMVSADFEERLDTELPPHLLWDCPDVSSFAHYLIDNVSQERLDGFVSSV
ncbi:MAG TPA: acyl carrier protein [Allosphingosinicella sp.]|jgi:hypothetical protein